MLPQIKIYFHELSVLSGCSKGTYGASRRRAKCDFASIKWWRCWESNPGPNECTVKALARRNSFTPPKGREVPLARLPSSLPVPVGYTLSFTSDTTLLSNSIRQSRRWGGGTTLRRSEFRPSPTSLSLRLVLPCGQP